MSKQPPAETPEPPAEIPEQAKETPEPSPPKLSRFERRQKAAADALRTLIRDLYGDRFAKGKNNPETLELVLSVKVEPGNDWALEFDPEVQDQLLLQLEDAEAGGGFWRDGFVYCFRCDSIECACARCPSLLSVFHRYDSMGKPQWVDFTQSMLDAKHESVDLLYEKQPPLLTRIQFGKELKQEQLSSYGKSSKTYSILGQVTAGYFRVPQAIKLPEGSGNRVALSFQLVETRDAVGGVKVALNSLVGGLSIDQRLELFASDKMSHVYRAREVATRALKEISQEANAARKAKDTPKLGQAMKRVGGVMRLLATSLERGGRQQKRRTHHAEKRRSNPDRPVHKAYEEVQAVGDDALYYDDQHHTVVALAAKGRAHVFNFEGRHVTTFVVQAENVTHRLNTKRWRALDEKERKTVRAAIAANIPANIPSQKPG